jgi:hypothetical protein
MIPSWLAVIIVVVAALAASGTAHWLEQRDNRKSAEADDGDISVEQQRLRSIAMSPSQKLERIDHLLRESALDRRRDEAAQQVLEMRIEALAEAEASRHAKRARVA